MRPSPFDLRELRRQHERLKAYGEQSFRDNECDDWILEIYFGLIAAIALIPMLCALTNHLWK